MWISFVTLMAGLWAPPKILSEVRGASLCNSTEQHCSHSPDYSSDTWNILSYSAFLVLKCCSSKEHRWCAANEAFRAFGAEEIIQLSFFCDTSNRGNGTGILLIKYIQSICLSQSSILRGSIYTHIYIYTYTLSLQAKPNSGHRRPNWLTEQIGMMLCFLPRAQMRAV